MIPGMHDHSCVQGVVIDPGNSSQAILEQHVLNHGNQGPVPVSDATLATE